MGEQVGCSSLSMQAQNADSYTALAATAPSEMLLTSWRIGGEERVDWDESDPGRM